MENEVIISVVVEDVGEERKKEIKKAVVDFAKAIFPSLKIESVEWKEVDANEENKIRKIRN